MFILIVLGVVWLPVSTVGCPSAEDLAPFCKCRLFGGEHMMKCRKVLSPEDLISPIKTLALHNKKIFSLEIRDSTFQYIPKGIFRGVSIEKIRFFRSEILALSESDVAFDGLEDILTEIRATDAEYVTSWDWNQLRNLKKLDLIDVNKIVFGALDEPFPRLPTLSALGITRAGLTHLVDGAFAELSGLRMLILKNNELVELKRNMLPDPGDYLTILDLSNNQISQLPEDFFRSLPNLNSVHLDRNKFVTIAEYPFKQSFGEVNELTMAENPLRCDCRIRWLAGARTPSKFVATCALPDSMKGRSIEFLDLWNLWC